MAITLADAKVGMADKIDQQVIDEFRRGSMLLDRMIFDDAVSPGTGGSTLTYGYMRLETPAVAGFRKINHPYDNQEAIRQAYTANLKIFGGAFELDRVIAQTGGAIDEVNFQLQQKIKAATNLFHYAVINGDEGQGDGEVFDGLDVALVDSSTEIGKETYLDLSTTAKVDDNYMAAIDTLDNFLSELDGRPTFLLGNSKLLTKIKAVARRAGYLTPSEDAFGRKAEAYDGIPLIDLQYYVNESFETVPTVPIVEREIDSGTVTGLTDLYAVRLGLDGFHGVTVTGNGIINTYIPDFNQPGPVKTGEVEMVAAVVLKATRAAGVLRNIKVM